MDGLIRNSGGDTPLAISVVVIRSMMDGIIPNSGGDTPLAISVVVIRSMRWY